MKRAREKPKRAPAKMNQSTKLETLVKPMGLYILCPQFLEAFGVDRAGVVMMLMVGKGLS
jgi:hypothetical protein